MSRGFLPKDVIQLLLGEKSNRCGHNQYVYVLIDRDRDRHDANLPIGEEMPRGFLPKDVIQFLFGE